MSVIGGAQCSQRTLSPPNPPESLRNDEKPEFHETEVVGTFVQGERLIC